MGDDETIKKHLDFLARPPKRVNQMTPAEVSEWAEQLAERLNPANRSSTHIPKRPAVVPEPPSQVTNDVAELNAGKITAQQLGERWAVREWPSIIKGPRTVEAIAALEAADFMGATGTWHEVEELRQRGVLSATDYDAICEVMHGIHEERANGAVSMMDVVEFLVNHPENVGKSMQRDDAFSNVERLLPAALEKLVTSGRRWVVIVELLSDPTKYVQVLVTSSGSMWAECVSNAFLDDDHRLDDAQCELLPTLGWEWPGPPAFPNWHLHDELLNTGPVMSGLLIRTLRRVFRVESDDRINVSTREVKEKLDPVEKK